MYKAGMKLVELCRMTKSMANIEEDAVEKNNAAIEDEDEGLGGPATAAPE